MNNLDYFNLSLTSSEPIAEPHYYKEKLVIPSNKSDDNTLTNANNDLIKIISLYKDADASQKNKLLTQLLQILKVDGINFSEFVTYWSIHDVSHTQYKKMVEGSKIQFLKEVLPSYIKYRHNIYLDQGYTNTTLQVRSDSNAHKRNSDTGSAKIAAILSAHKFSHFTDNNSDKFLKNENRVYILPDSPANCYLQK